MSSEEEKIKVIESELGLCQQILEVLSPETLPSYRVGYLREIFARKSKESDFVLDILGYLLYNGTEDYQKQLAKLLAYYNYKKREQDDK